MRVFRVRRALLSAASSSSSDAAASFGSASARVWSRRSASIGRRAFSSFKFPTSDESAILAHVDDEHDPNCSQLVCGSCNTPLSQTKDLIFFKWKNGIHLSSTTDAPMRNLCSQGHWDEDVSWKKHKLHCLKCDHHVGTMAKVFTSDKILFSAKQVAIQMPAHQSPLTSISGYPSSQLGFSYWTELILMLETQPTLKEALQIRRVDQIRDFSDARKKLNTKLLMAKDQRALLRIVDEHFSEMNDVNILTAVDRAARFAANPTSRKNRMSVIPRMNFLTKSEAPEDQLLDMSPSFLARPRTPQEIATEKERFWKLILLAENLVNFSISIMKDGYELANFIKSIGRLGVGRQSILEPVAKQVLFVLNSDTEKHIINPHEASIIATAIVHVSAKDLRGEPWMKGLLHAAANTLLDESTRKGKPCGLEVLIPLVRSFVIADEFHEELFALMFDELKRDRLETSAMLTPFKVRNLKSKLYQVHLDCLLHDRDTKTLCLSSSLAEESKELFQSHQTQLKSTSFRIQHLVSTALDEMGIEHERSLGLDEGYSLDIALKKQMIAIEINDADSYQVLEDDGADEIPFGFVDLKARHLEQLGWVVIQLRADKYEQLGSVDDRVRYLSMLLEVANNARRTQQ
uniref:RAP domain-containing protein n=1 Tax=Globisporangium ultimum (strain ATCC 200006 / CBS 805.95 / DAOM BR144) TaxID=431595 RepID=K3X909_GLOUD